MSKTIDIVGIGEPLVEFSAVTLDGREVFQRGFGGDTSNAVIAAARQGASCAFFTALGDDRFGPSFLDLWDREKVDRSSVTITAGKRTGIYFITQENGDHSFTYWREGSAASLISPDSLPKDVIAAARVLHVSGISQAISQSACDCVDAAITQAKRHGTLVNYDTNLRLRLWPLEKARQVIHASVARSDIARPGLDDAMQLTGLDRPEDICDFYLGLGPQIVALTMGSKGTMVAIPGERRVLAAMPVTVVDATWRRRYIRRGVSGGISEDERSISRCTMGECSSCAFDARIRCC